jgi:2-hydroxycyclohexanecarboxyl-CoA dehydrogenase
MAQDVRVAVVTGAAQGIGEATARLLAGRGLTVVVVDRQEEGGRRVAEGIRAAGGEARFVRCDLGNHDEVGELAGTVERELGAVHALVNNAGWTPNQRFLEQGPDVWAQVVAINYLAVLSTCRLLVPLMPEGSSIVNVASDAARLGVPREAVYAGAKAAVIGFSKSLAVELGERRIRVNVVSPGTTLTPLVRDMLTDEQVERRTRAVPLGRLAEPEDVAEVIGFLVEGAGYVTGQVVSVNGGSSRPG